MSEIGGLLNVVTTRLRAAAPLTALVAAARIQRSPVELTEGTEKEPYIVIEPLAAPDVNFLTARMFTATRFLVRGVTVGRILTTGESIAAAIDTALLAVTGEDVSAFGVHVGRIWRVEDYYLPQVVDGETWHNRGGIYRSQVWRL